MIDSAIRHYFALPKAVKPGDFVHQIDAHAGGDSVEKTLRDYQVTPSIARNFDHALDNVVAGLEQRRSVFTWIHGSFGCGKSHFMNMLSLLLADEKAVYTLHPELQEQRKRFAGKAIGKKLFRLHVQCISRGATSLEEIVFRAAIEELARLHPGVPVPALFEVQKLFTAAVRLRADLGDEKFFGAFASNKGGGDGDWGDLGGAAWTGPRLESAVAAPDTAEARLLAGELARTPWLEGMASGSELVKLGPGLQILADHLKRLGYEGVVLFLDELVLWLSTFQDPKKLSLETPKVSTLVEHGDYPPAIPYLTFAARQRDLSEMVGKLAIGRDEVIFRDQLSFWKDRFDTLSLEDKDLPRIIEKRVLGPASPEAKVEIDRAFDAWKRVFAEDFRRLNGDQGDADDFRRVYPFSPKLVEVMVALSATLQRDRTALRELTRLLIEYLPDWELGKVVPIGDLFDVVVHGKTSDLPALQRLYEQARNIYERDLLPHIRRKQKTDNPERCQLLREEFDKSLGCSGCPESACRTRTRIAKTVLMQGIVPSTGALKDLTASSLVYLNSGTLKSKVPNQETAMAAELLKEWQGVTPAIHIQGEADPHVHAILDTVDVRRIIDSCRDLDNQQRRRIRVRDTLFEKMGVARKDQSGSRTVTWRGRRWQIGVVYDNVRLANDNVFRPAEGEDLRLVVDFPFDDLGWSPRQDEEALAKVVERLTGKEAEQGLATVVWLPAFLDGDTGQALEDLIILEGLLELRDTPLAQRIPFVSIDDLPKVRSTLEQQREHKRAQVENTLLSAYGISHEFDKNLAPGLAPEKHAHLLRRDAKLSVPTDGLFERALDSLVQQALEIRAASHPKFEKLPTKARLERVLELLDAVLETPDRKLRLERSAVDDLSGIAGAVHLGIVRAVEDDVIYTGGILDAMARRLAQHRGPLSVGAVRSAIDPEQVMSLADEVEDFLILAYAKVATKPLRFFAGVSAVEGGVGRLADDLALIPVELPTQQTWQRALHAAALFGVVPSGKALTPARVDELAAMVKKAASTIGAPRALEAFSMLGEWQRLVGIEGDFEASPRGIVLRVIHSWIDAVSHAADSAQIVATLAGLEWDAARTTAIVHMTGSRRIDALVEALRSESNKTALARGHELELQPERAADVRPIMSRVRTTFGHDENVDALRPVLDREAARITQLLFDAPTASPPATPQSAPQPASVLAPPRAEVAPAAPPPPTGRAETITVRSSSELERFIDAQKAKLSAGQRLRITVEIVDGDER